MRHTISTITVLTYIIMQAIFADKLYNGTWLIARGNKEHSRKAFAQIRLLRNFSTKAVVSNELPKRKCN